MMEFDQLAKILESSQLLLKLDDIEIYDFNIFNSENCLLEKFISEYDEVFENHFFRLLENSEMLNEIYFYCSLHKINSEYEFYDSLRTFLWDNQNIDTDYFTNEELLTKFKSEATELFIDTYKILNIYWDRSYYFRQEFTWINKEIFFSMLNYFYRIDCTGLNKINQTLDIKTFPKHRI